VVVSIGDTAITQSDIKQEFRFESFLDGQWPAPPPDATALERARDRLVYQKLLELEGETDADGLAEARKAAAERLSTIRSRFSRPEDFEAALRTLGIDEKQLLDRLVAQTQVLRIIDQRLRPSASPNPAEIENYYQQVFLPEFKRRNKTTPPALADVEEQIREILVQQNINVSLTKWLDSMRASYRVKVHSF
jgi:hypothetical protein